MWKTLFWSLWKHPLCWNSLDEAQNILERHESSLCLQGHIFLSVSFFMMSYQVNITSSYIQVAFFWVMTPCRDMVLSSEVLESCHITTQCHNPEDCNFVFITVQTSNLASCYMFLSKSCDKIILFPCTLVTFPSACCSWGKTYLGVYFLRNKLFILYTCRSPHKYVCLFQSF